MKDVERNSLGNGISGPLTWLGGLTVFGLVIWVGWSRLGSSPQGPPLDLRSRCLHVARAFLETDEASLDMVAAPGDRETLHRWVRLARTNSWRMSMNRETPPALYGLPQNEADVDSASIGLKYQPREVNPQLERGSLVRVAWKRGPRGEWLLDGTATLKLTPNLK